MKTIWIIVAILVVLGLGWYFLQSSQLGVSAPTPTPTPTASPTPTPENKVTVEMTAEGFTPSVLNIKPGTTVDFVNKDTKPHWPASGPHPQHTNYPGFDSKKGIEPGETYTFTFNMVKSTGFHDHLNPALRGTVNVAP